MKNYDLHTRIGNCTIWKTPFILKASFFWSVYTTADELAGHVCPDPFDAEHLTFDSCTLEGCVRVFEAFLDLYVGAQWVADLWGHCKEQSSNPKGKRQRQWEQNKSCVPPPKSTLCSTLSWEPTSQSHHILPRLHWLAAESVCSVHCVQVPLWVGLAGALFSVYTPWGLRQCVPVPFLHSSLYISSLLNWDPAVSLCL